jgi:hypothetical protein
VDWESDLPDDDATLGEPVAELRALRVEPEVGFVDRIRGSINRRVLTADTLDLSLRSLFQTFFEYLTSMIQAFSEAGDKPKEP